MFSVTKIILSAALAVVVVNAQSSAAASGSASVSATGAGAALPSGLAGVSPCILACVVPAATQNNCTFADTSCVCLSAQFQADAGACLVAHCTQADQATAAALQQAQCAAVGTPSVSATGINSVPFTSAAAATGGAGANSTGSGTAGAASQTPTTPAGNGTSPATKPSGASPMAVANTFGLAVAAAFAGALVL